MLGEGKNAGVIRGEDYSPLLTTQDVKNDLLHDALSEFIINGTKRRIQKDYGCSAVDTTSKTQSLSLTSRQKDTSFTNLGVMTMRKHLHVMLEFTGFDRLPIAFVFVRTSEQNILLD